MAVKRSQRQFGIQPIGVNRVAPFNQDVAREIVGIADDIYTRQYDIAKNDAVKRGEETAAEAPLSSITQLNPDTKTPMAIEFAQGMGRFSRDAFERSVLRRFEGAISDDIAAKKDELMARLGESADAPKLFEKAFSEYLGGLAGNASGYYKQVIVDHGASQLEDGRSRLHVAQIKRMQAQARLERERRLKQEERNAYNAGMSGSTYTFNETVSEFRAAEADAQAIGASEPDTTTKRGKVLRNAFLRGSVSKKMQDPSLAMQAGLISQVLQDGKNPALYNLLNQKGKDFIASIEVAFDVDEQIDYPEIAEVLKSELKNAEDSGTYLSAAMENQRKLNEANIEASKEVDKQYTDAQILDLQKRTDSGEPFTIGYTGDPSSILAEKNRLLALDDNLSVATVSRDALGKLQSATNDNLVRLAGGAIARELDAFVRQGGTKQGLQEFVDALKSPTSPQNKDLIGNLLGQDVYNVLATQITQENSGYLSNVAQDILDGVSSKVDHAANLSKQSMRESKVEVSSLIRSPNSTIAEIDAAIDRFKASHKDVDAFSEAYGDLLAQRDSRANTIRGQEFTTESNKIVSSANESNIAESAKQLEETAKRFGQDPASAEAFAKTMVEQVASNRITSEMSGLGQDDASLRRLSEWTAYLKGTSANISIEDKAVLDEIIRGYPVTVNGKKISPDRDALASSANSTLTALQNVADRNNRAAQRAASINQIKKGNYSIGADSSDGRIAYEKLLAEEKGRANLSGLLTKPELDENDIEILTTVRDNYGILPESFKTSVSLFLSGGMPQEEMAILAPRLIDLVYFQDSNGKFKKKAGVERALSPAVAAKLDAVIAVTQMLPAGLEMQGMTAAIDQINLADRDTKTVATQINVASGKENAQALVASLDRVNPTQVPHLVELARTMVAIPQLSAELKTNMQRAVDSNYVQNNNMYSGWSGGSFSAYSPDRFVKNGTEIVEKYIPSLIADEGLENVYFEAGSNVSIERYFRDQSYLGEMVSDTASTVTGKTTISEQVRRARGGQLRVIYGETFRSTPSRPEYQLMAINENGLVDPLGVTFTLQEAILAAGQEIPDLTSTFFTPPETDPSEFGAFGQVGR